MEFVKDYVTKREKSRRFTSQAAELRRNPGEWGILVTDAPNRWAAKHVSTGQLVDFAPRGTFQGSARKNDDGTYTILARFMGERRVKTRSDVVTTPVTAEHFEVPDGASVTPDFTTHPKYANPEKLARAVRKNEGSWCIIRTGCTTTAPARDITKGRSETFPSYEYRATAVRDPHTKLFTIYARYVGLDA